MYEETSAERGRRERDNALTRIAGIVKVLAMERHAALMAVNHPSHNYNFESCSDDLCMEACRAAEEVGS